MCELGMLKLMISIVSKDMMWRSQSAACALTSLVLTNVVHSTSTCGGISELLRVFFAPGADFFTATVECCHVHVVSSFVFYLEGG